jgi:hypothetical protein
MKSRFLQTILELLSDYTASNSRGQQSSENKLLILSYSVIYKLIIHNICLQIVPNFLITYSFFFPIPHLLKNAFLASIRVLTSVLVCVYVFVPYINMGM